MHVYQMRSSVPSVRSTTQDRIHKCMDALKEVSKVWLVAKMVHTLFEYILGNKKLEDRLQKAAGERHSRMARDASAGAKREEPPKRKFDEMDLPFSNGPPTPQVSYERSRPQTPAPMPSRDLAGHAHAHAPGLVTVMGAPALPVTSAPPRPATDTLIGGLTSRSITRPPTPFNPSFSVPNSPPDLFLVTRNSPPISQNMWENFQPDQLFPENSGNMPLASFAMPNLDPQLAPPLSSSSSIHTASQLAGSGIPPPPPPPQPPLAHRNLGIQGLGPLMGGSATGVQASQSMLGVPASTNIWPNQLDGMDLPGNDREDSGNNNNNSNNNNLTVPATLNVDDW